MHESQPKPYFYFLCSLQHEKGGLENRRLQYAVFGCTVIGSVPPLSWGEIVRLRQFLWLANCCMPSNPVSLFSLLSPM